MFYSSNIPTTARPYRYEVPATALHTRGRLGLWTSLWWRRGLVPISGVRRPGREGQGAGGLPWALRPCPACLLSPETNRIPCCEQALRSRSSSGDTPRQAWPGMPPPGDSHWRGRGPHRPGRPRHGGLGVPVLESSRGTTACCLRPGRLRSESHECWRGPCRRGASLPTHHRETRRSAPVGVAFPASPGRGWGRRGHLRTLRRGVWVCWPVSRGQVGA